MILFPDDTSIADAAAGLSDMKTMMAESKIKMGDFYFRKRHHYAAAKIFYNEAITAYPESPVAEKAKKRLTAVESAMEKASKNHPGKKKRFWLF
jgi:outer membrane protein assembly factor BamD